MQDPQIPQSIWYLTDADFVGFRVVRPLRTPTPEEAKRYDLDEEQLREMRSYEKAARRQAVRRRKEREKLFGLSSKESR